MDATPRTLHGVWLVYPLSLVLLVLYAVLFDNGALLSPAIGTEAAQAANYMHELFHDGRHLLGTPCH